MKNKTLKYILTITCISVLLFIFAGCSNFPNSNPNSNESTKEDELNEVQSFEETAINSADAKKAILDACTYLDNQTNFIITSSCDYDDADRDDTVGLVVCQGTGTNEVVYKKTYSKDILLTQDYTVYDVLNISEQHAFYNNNQGLTLLYYHKDNIKSGSTIANVNVLAKLGRRYNDITDFNNQKADLKDIRNMFSYGFESALNKTSTIFSGINMKNNTQQILMKYDELDPKATLHHTSYFNIVDGKLISYVEYRDVPSGVYSNSVTKVFVEYNVNEPIDIPSLSSYNFS